MLYEVITRNLSAKQIFISDEVINDELARIEKTLSKTQYLLFEIFLPYSMAENQETLENTARITSYNVCYTKLLRFLTVEFAAFPFTRRFAMTQDELKQAVAQAAADHVAEHTPTGSIIGVGRNNFV